MRRGEYIDLSGEVRREISDLFQLGQRALSPFLTTSTSDGISRVGTLGKKSSNRRDPKNQYAWFIRELCESRAQNFLTLF